MQTVDVVVETPCSTSTRAMQVSAMFDAPPASKLKKSWRFEHDLDEDPWSIGLIVGPSGSGKSTVARHMYGAKVDAPQAWSETSVIDDFAESASIEDISKACSSVGFNTIPAWLKPFHVLSTGEKFRVSVARRMVEATPGETIVVDEFTSVVDRQVAKIGAHAIQKMIRRGRHGKRFVAVTCHQDVKEWLQPDWVIDMSNGGSFRRRQVHPRPEVEVHVGPIARCEWARFSEFHYMSAAIASSSRCYGAFVGGELVAFASAMHRPISRPGRFSTPIWGMPRLVTLPDFQGLGLAMMLSQKVGAAYKRRGLRFRSYPAHSSLIRSFDRSPDWTIRKKPSFSTRVPKKNGKSLGSGGRPCAVFEFCGAASDEQSASNLVDYFKTHTNSLAKK